MSDESNTPKLPKEELLLKLLKMTTSPNDGEALTSVRKANALLVSAGWDWDKLIRSKIVVVADPFSSIQAPPTSTRHQATYAGASQPYAYGRPNPAPPPPRQPPPPMTPRPPPQPDPQGTPKNPLSAQLGGRINLYVGHCHACGIEVTAKAGHIVQSHGKPDWKVICTTCDTTATLARYPAPHVRVKRKKSISDLA